MTSTTRVRSPSIRAGRASSTPAMAPASSRRRWRAHWRRVTDAVGYVDVLSLALTRPVRRSSTRG
jgi:hypothetical protein